MTQNCCRENAHHEPARTPEGHAIDVRGVAIVLCECIPVEGVAFVHPDGYRQRYPLVELGEASGADPNDLRYIAEQLGKQEAELTEIDVMRWALDVLDREGL